MTHSSTRSVGGIEVIALRDGAMTAPNGLFPLHDMDRAVAAAKQAGDEYDGTSVTVPVNAFAIRTGGRVLLVDAGAPDGYSGSTGHFGEALAGAGIAAAEVDTLAMTHLHIDHVGQLTGPDGAARFPNAELVSGAGDWAHFHSDEVYARANTRARGSIDVSRRILAPYAERRRDAQGETPLAPGVTMIPLPGHTPGHSGILIEDGGEQLLIWGDIIHSETFQLAEPDWSVLFDIDQDQARETRKALFDRAASDRLMITGPHVRFPGFARVERMTRGYRLVHEG
ncbi:MBL fold metallo-hydrolase [Pseudooceanicola sp. 216_PA32_1]|uniref:MBL fold metallo-hydrolase n=1 Tax=Pseudooceanicola pacificus TaxID=2676438 RepID=A0A844W1H9_9RHOB|nr:MBL fold metallo-hydrolase [Pseudooceanicola pacificus]MWB77976.1 MBL fold metallo-hydrolase [Pseudooceanicola pacificus]